MKDLSQKLFLEWKGEGYPQDHEFPRRSMSMHTRDPLSPHANNLMGILAYQKNDFISASKYFKFASESSFFNDGEYLRNYVTAQNKINYVETVDTIVAELRKDVYNDVLYKELYKTLSDLQEHYNLPHYIVARAVRSLPSKYNLWIVLVNSILRHYAQLQTSVLGVPQLPEPIFDFKETTQAPGHEELGAQHLTLFGLTMFPRCPELLLLYSMIRYDAGDVVCARHIMGLATAVQSLRSDNYSEVHHTLFQHTLNSTAASQPTTTADADIQCLPFVYRHNKAEYQSIYNNVASVLGAGWSALTNVSAAPSEWPAANRLVRESVARAAFVTLDGSTTTLHLPALQVGCSSYESCARPGFYIADALASPSTHFVTLAYNLSMIESASLGLLYSSHTLEHLSHNLPPPSCGTYPVSNRSVAGCSSEVDTALAEWRRVLATGGKLLLSVPDLVSLARYFIRPDASKHAKAVLRNIFFGGQVNQYDVHKTGFYLDALQEQLASHGFCGAQQVEGFDIFRDTSSANFYFNESISLNVVATACV